MPWFDDMIDDWCQKRKGSDKTLARHLHMTEMQAERWLAERPSFVSGSDEVGYGALAGPLVVCAICAPYSWTLPGLRDSKQLSDSRREQLVADIHQEERLGRVRIHVAYASAERLDALGAITALRIAHATAHEAITGDLPGTMLVVDGNLDLPGRFHVPIPKADTFIPQVMAASNLAKYVRDCYMKDLASTYPGYGFERHVGYGTPEHYEALECLGPCEIHRRTYNLHAEKKDDAGDREDDRSPSEAVGEFAQGQRNVGGSDPGIPEQRKPLRRPR